MWTRGIALSVLFIALSGAYNSDAGVVIRYRCPACQVSGELALGPSLGGSYFAAYLCKQEKTAPTLISVKENGRSRTPASKPNCPSGFERVNLVRGMTCPICPGQAMEVEVVELWD